MSDNATFFNNPPRLASNDGATAAALELIKAACESSGNASGQHPLEWVSADDNLKKLRDKIKECAAST